MRIFSGIQPTGRKHLGNYIGAITQWVAGQDRGEAIYCLVDLHAITVPYEPAALRDAVYDTAATLLAAGLDPARCIFFRQSDVQGTAASTNAGPAIRRMTMKPSQKSMIARGTAPATHPGALYSTPPHNTTQATTRTIRGSTAQPRRVVSPSQVSGGREHTGEMRECPINCVGTGSKGDPRVYDAAWLLDRCTSVRWCVRLLA